MKRVDLEWEVKSGRRRLGDGIFSFRRFADPEMVRFVNKGELEESFNGVTVKFDLRVGDVCINGREEEDCLVL